MNFLFYFKDLFTALILRPLLRDPFRGVITILGVAIGVAVFLSIRLTNAQTMLSFPESIARALVHQPSIILADEPTGNLDSENGTKILELMKKVSTEFQTTLVVVTHNPQIATGN